MLRRLLQCLMNHLSKVFTHLDVIRTYNAALTKLIKRVKKLEQTIKTSKARRRAKIVLSEDEDAEEDSSKQEMKIFAIDKDPTISLIRTSVDTEVLLEEEEPTELVEDQGSAEKSEKRGRVSTASRLDSTVEVSTASEMGSTAGVKAKDKGKAIMKEDEYVQKKSKKQLEQERLGHEEAIRLQEQIDEEERQRIAKDAEIAKQLQEEIDIARKKEGVAKVDEAHDIDWSDPAVIRYHTLQNRSRSVAEVRKNMCIYLKNQGGYKMKHFNGMSYEDIRPIFKRVWDQIHSFVPMDSELEIQRKIKRASRANR
ncbi:hypothetical protein Tco_1487056 [Tanacetum coccineum]